MQCIITAGGFLKENSPLFINTGIRKKAFLPMGDKMMIDWVADAAMASKYIDGLVAVGLEPGALAHTGYPIEYVADTGGLIPNVIAGSDAAKVIDPNSDASLLCTSDIPLINTTIIDEFIETCLRIDADVHYAVVTEAVMEARFPGSKRTFTPMKGGRYSGGDMFMLTNRPVSPNVDLFETLSGERKSPWRQAKSIGFGFIFRFLLRQMDIHEAMAEASRVAHLHGEAIEFPWAEIAMDVDKWNQYLLVKQELEMLRS